MTDYDVISYAGPGWGCGGDRWLSIVLSRTMDIARKLGTHKQPDRSNDELPIAQYALSNKSRCIVTRQLIQKHQIRFTLQRGSPPQTWQSYMSSCGLLLALATDDRMAEQMRSNSREVLAALIPVDTTNGEALLAAENQIEIKRRLEEVTKEQSVTTLPWTCGRCFKKYTARLELARIHRTKVNVCYTRRPTRPSPSTASP